MVYNEIFLCGRRIIIIYLFTIIESSFFTNIYYYFFFSIVVQYIAHPTTTAPLHRIYAFIRTYI